MCSEMYHEMSNEKRGIFQTAILIFIFRIIGCSIPVVLNTWKFTHSAEKAWEALQYPETTLIEAVTIGCSTCEEDQCDYTVGYGGSPDENGESTLDAFIFDGTNIDMGAVGGLRRIKNAIGVARHVLEQTEHSLLVGDLATEFAKNFGFKEETLTTNYSDRLWQSWREKQCQPNFWQNVHPNPKISCGPYEPSSCNEIIHNLGKFDNGNHDTIGMLLVGRDGQVVAGTSTNGANHKVPGRVGDSPIPGAGGYADSEIGGAVATGDGDIMMRFLPSFLAVEEMRRGTIPAKAAQTAISRIAKKYPNFFGAVLAVDNKGEYGAACHGMDVFPFMVINNNFKGIVLKNCTSL